MDSDTTSLPDYLNDLNAMHDAEKTLPNKHDYLTQLWLVVGNDKKLSDIISATAAQRAEAFLRTVGKWVEKTS